MSEIQRVADIDTVEDRGPTWEECLSEWTSGQHTKLLGQLRQARAAAAVKTHYGSGSIEAFAKEVGAAPTTVYEYAKAWRRLLTHFESEDEIYTRLESSPMNISRVMEATRGPIEEIGEALDRAEDENQSKRQIERDRKERSTPGNVEVITEFLCPECGALSPMSAVETREAPA